MPTHATRSLIVAILLTCNLTASAQPATNTDNQSEPKLDELKRLLLEINNKRVSAETELEQSRIKLKQDIETTTSTSKSETAKETREAIAQALKAYQDAQAKAGEEVLQARYLAGTAALTHMKQSVRIIDFIHELVDVEIEFDEKSSIWSDRDFRNGWDTLRDASTIIGVIAGLVPVLLKDDNPLRPMFGAITVGVVGIGNLLGGLLGKFGWTQEDSANVLSQKMQTLDVSRRAYDALAERRKMLNEFHAQNSKFVGALEEFERTYNAAASKDDKLRVVTELAGSKLSEFDSVVRQIPALLSTYQSFIDIYDKYKWSSELKGKMHTLSEKVTKAKMKYNDEIAPILRLSTTLQISLLYGSSK